MEEFAKIGFALFTLTAMEIVLGIDNIVFLSIVSSRLPVEQQPSARRIGLGLALAMRILLLLCLKLVLGWTSPLFSFSDFVPESGILSGLSAWLSHSEHHEVDGVSVRDLILLVGGLFLIGKSVMEIHHKMQGESHGGERQSSATMAGVLCQIVVLDVVFSLDSVITAVGMADEIWVMVVAVIIAVGVMIMLAESISRFVENNPTLKMLALSFLILIGVMLVAEGTGTEMDKGYIYFAMVFALVVELLNLRLRRRHAVISESAATP